MSTIHVFSDNGGFFSKTAIQQIESIDPKNHFYWFINGKPNLEFVGVNYLFDLENVYRLLNEGNVQKMVFHSLQDHQFMLLSDLKQDFPKLKVAWVFWSFEYYQQTFNLKYLYSKHNQWFKLRKFLSNYWLHFNYWRKNKAIGMFPMSKTAYQAFIEQVDDFYAFVPNDGAFVFQEKSKVNRFQFSYLMLSSLEKQVLAVDEQSLIMVGHNGNPLVNHQEALELLAKFQVKNKVLIPLSYGKKAYIQQLKKYVSTSDLTIQLMEDFLPIDVYYRMLSEVGVYIQPTRCQQGLGNIIYFLLSGASVYLCESTSTFQFLKVNGLHIFHLDELKNNGIQLLNEEQKKFNAAFIKAFIADEKVEAEWRHLLS